MNSCKVNWVQSLAAARGLKPTRAKNWNIVKGCSPVSAGCEHCYAARLAATRLAHNPRYAGLAEKYEGGYRYNGRIRLDEELLLEPLKACTPAVVFVCSMGDLFHEDVPDKYIDQVFAVMAATPHLVYQVLTKRPERMADYFNNRDDTAGHIDFQLVQILGAERDTDDPTMQRVCRRWPLHNVWLGTSVENQVMADKRIPHLLRCPAAVRFVSVEPMLGAVDASSHLPCPECKGHGRYVVGNSFRQPLPNTEPCQRCIKAAKACGQMFPAKSIAKRTAPYIDWVIVGGESGPGARPMHPDWPCAVRDQCIDAGVPFFLKQMRVNGKIEHMPKLEGKVWDQVLGVTGEH